MNKIAASKMKAKEKGKLRKYAKYLEEGALGDTKKAPKGKIVGKKKRHKETMKVFSGNKDAPNKKIGKKTYGEYPVSKKESSKAKLEKRNRRIMGGNPVKGYKDPIKKKMKTGGEVYKKTGKGSKLEKKVVKGVAKGVQKFEKVMGIDPSNTDKQDLGVMSGAMAGGAAGSSLGPLGALVGIVGGARAGKKLMTKKKKAKKEMGGKVKYENGGPISNKGKKTFITRDESGKVGPAYQQQQRPDVGKQGYSDAEQVDRWKAIKEYDSAPGGEDILKSKQRQAFTDVMKSKFKKAGEITSKMKEMKLRGKPEMKEGGPVAKHDKGQKGASKKKSSFMDDFRALAMLESNQKYKTGKDMNKAWGKTKEKLASIMKSSDSEKKATLYKDGGAVRVHEGNVHKSAGEPVTTYQASNSNYKEGK